MGFFLFPRSDKAELFRRCQAGEKDACNDLFVLIRPLIEKAIRDVFRYIDEETLEDVVQEVYWKIIRKIITVRGDRQFEKWVNRVAIRCGLDALREATSGPSIGPIVIDIEIKEEKKSSPLPELGDCPEKVLAKLGDEYRKVFDLIFVQEGVTQDQAAEILGVVVRTIRNRRKKILEELRICVEKMNR